jgi:hypothetical protein
MRPVTTLAYIATIDHPGRFGFSKALGAHLGLTPHVYQSVEIDRSEQISKCGDRMIRHLLDEAASGVMTRGRKWSRLRAWGISVAKRRSIKRATVIGDVFEIGKPAMAANAAQPRARCLDSLAGDCGPYGGNGQVRDGRGGPNDLRFGQLGRPVFRTLSWGNCRCRG